MAQKTVLITCFGTRGDVQPFVNLGIHLQANHGMKVILTADPEFETLITMAGLGYEPLKRSLVRELQETEAGKMVKKAKPWKALGAMKGFLLSIMKDTVQDVKRAMDKCKPDLVVFTTFLLMADTQILCRQHQPPIPYMFCHTVPSSPTGEFAPTTAGVGVSLPFGFLNRAIWKLGEVALRQLYLKTVIPEIHKVLSLQTDIDLTLAQSELFRKQKILVAYIYAQSLLPKPADWMDFEVVTGPLLDELDLHPERDIAYQLPSNLDAYMKQAQMDGVPLVYVGIGSMLGTLFEEVEITEILNSLANGAVLAQSVVPCRVLIHTTTGKPKPGQISYTPPNPEAAKAFFALSVPVPHRHIFRKCAFVITHGGAGSMQAALLAGVPSAAIPCGPTTDQPFWAALLAEKKLGPCAFPIGKLTADRFAKLLVKGLEKGEAVELFRKNAKVIAERVMAERGSERFTDMILQQLDKNAHPSGNAV